jgi:hypothetical protein
MNYEEAISQLSDEDHARLVADTLYGALLGFTSAGVSPQKAVRAVMVTFLQGVHGPQVWKSLGVPQTTAERWRREYREVKKLVQDIPEEIPAEAIDAYVQLVVENAKKDQEAAK